MATSTLKDLLLMQREDFIRFETKHDVVHTALDKKVDGLISFKTKVITWSTIGGFLLGIFLKVVIFE